VPEATNYAPVFKTGSRLTQPSYATIGRVKMAKPMGRYLGHGVVGACRKLMLICNGLWRFGRASHLNSGSRFSNSPGA
jgi:hypothetical protein